MTVTDLKKMLTAGRHAHLIGIGGVSMFPLAELLKVRGLVITGSDAHKSPNVEHLLEQGFHVTIGHFAENVQEADLVIRTAAVHDDNPEIVRAHELGIPVMERAEAWGHLMRDYDNVVCLAGTHGKTTSTSMMTLMTMEAQMDPTVMVGSNLPAIGGTLRIGGKGCFVAESCEYCNSFLRFAPTVAVILNVEEDHLDFFKDINDIIHSFHEFAELTPMNGLVVVNGDDPHAMRSVAGINRKVRTFGTSATSDVYPTDVRDENGYYRFTVNIDGKEYADIALDHISTAFGAMSKASDSMTTAASSLSNAADAASSLVSDFAAKEPVKFVKIDDSFTTAQNDLFDSLKKLSDSVNILVDTASSDILVNDLRALSDQIFKTFGKLIDIVDSVSDVSTDPEVTVNKLRKYKYILMPLFTVAVTV